MQQCAVGVEWSGVGGSGVEWKPINYIVCRRAEGSTSSHTQSSKSMCLDLMPSPLARCTATSSSPVGCPLRHRSSSDFICLLFVFFFLVWLLFRLIVLLLRMMSGSPFLQLQLSLLAGTPGHCSTLWCVGGLEQDRKIDWAQFRSLSAWRSGSLC